MPGGTLINGGSVIGTASSLRGLIVNNAQLTFGGATDGVFGGMLTGSGGLTKTGTGTLTLERRAAAVRASSRCRRARWR